MQQAFIFEEKNHFLSLFYNPSKPFLSFSCCSILCVIQGHFCNAVNLTKIERCCVKLPFYLTLNIKL